MERFPPTPEGRLEGWRRYVELEPSAVEAEPSLPWTRPPEPEEEGRRGVGKWVALGVVAALAIGIGAYSALSGGEQAGTTGGGGGGGESGAHVEVTGGQAVTEDLTLESFETVGLGSLYPNVKASWTGEDVRFAFDINQPRVGDNPTVYNPHREVRLGFTLADGTEVDIESVGGECTVTFHTLEEGHVAGSFTCTDLQGEGLDAPIDATGTFSASS